MTEVRTTSSTGAEKGVKPERYDLIPVDALAAVARLYGQGAKKYAEHNWRAGYEYSKSYAAMQRHANQFWNGEDVDPEMGESHLAAVIFHAMTLLTFQQEHPEFDDRYNSKNVSSDRSGLLDMLKPEATSEEFLTPYGKDNLEVNTKAFKDEQERAVRYFSMKAHPAGSGLKKDDKPAPMCAKCMQPIDNGLHDLSKPTLECPK